MLGGLDWGKRMYTCNRRRAIKLIPVIYHKMGSFDFGGQMSQLELDGLEFSNRFAKLFPLLHILQGCFQSRLGDPNHRNANANAPFVKSLNGYLGWHGPGQRIENLSF